jgi:ABC-2 type transport system permease protein
MNNKIWVIAKKDIGEAFRSRSTYFVVIIMIVLTAIYIMSYTETVKDYNKQQAITYSRIFLDSLAYIMPMMFSIFVCSVFANYSVIVDKAKRNIESLMATPVNIKQIWLGKSLAVTLPSLMVGITIAVLSYFVMNIWFVTPKTGIFIIPDIWAIVSAVLFVPALLFTIVAIVTYIQLVVTNPRIGNFVFSGIFFLLLIGVNTLSGVGLSFALIYLGVIVLCSVVSYFLSFSLTKERVLLSNKA